MAQDTNGNDLRAPILTFNSEVEEASGQFHYIYTVSNATASDIAVTWTDAGINGSVLAHGSLRHEIFSAGMPGTYNGAVDYTLNRAYASGVVLYAPAVPEPRAWAMWAAGLFFVVWFTLRANGIKPRARRRSEALLA